MLVVMCSRPTPALPRRRTSQRLATWTVTESWHHAKTWAGIPADVHSARDFTSRCLGAHHLMGYEPALSLVVSELCTNAVVHAQTSFTVTLEKRMDVLIVEVRDGGLAAPTKAAFSDVAAVSGRGLQLVESFSSSWGVWPRQDGKSVWATFTVHPGELPPGDVYGF